MTQRTGRSRSSKPPRKPSDSWRPAPHSSSSRPLTRASKGRLTLDFSGPLLPLPGEAPRQDPSEPARAAPSRAAVPDLSAPADDAWTLGHAARAPGASAPRLRSSTPPGLLQDHDGDALGLVDRNRPSTPGIDLAGEMRERFALGDFTGALRTAELILGQKPADEDALRCARNSRERLEQLYMSRLGRLELAPAVALADRDIRWLGLDHRAAFLLSRVDGMQTIEELCDVSGMPRLETLKTLVELLEQKAIRFPDRG